MEIVRVSTPDREFAVSALEWALEREVSLARMAVDTSRDRIREFEDRYGASLKACQLGRVETDDIDLAEWEGEVDALDRLRRKAAALKEIRIWHD